MEDIVLSFFELVLEVTFKLTLDVVNKSLKIYKVFLEKDFENEPCDRSSAFVMAYILSPFETNEITKK